MIDNCNFRCTYCMPAEIFGNSYRFLGGDELLSFDEIVAVARVCSELGVEKIKSTGGEPLLRPFLHDLIRRLREIPGIQDVGLITNGFYLRKLASRLAAAGLNRVSVSLDSLDQDVFTQMAGRHARVEQVLAAMDAAADAGLGPIKVNTVVQRGVNDDQVLSFVRHFGQRGYVSRFIEYMDVGNRNGRQRSHTVPSAELRERIGEHFTLTPLHANYGGEVATRYRVEELGSEIGFISPVTEPFCGGCTRLRVPADGTLYTCLFSVRGTDLREHLRTGATDEDLTATISGVWKGRRDRYSEDRLNGRAHNQEKVEMNRMGG